MATQLACGPWQDWQGVRRGIEDAHMRATPLTDLLLRVADDVRRITGGQLTWKDADLELRASQPRRLVEHHDRRCDQAKPRPGGCVACRAHCRLDLAFWRSRDRGPLARTCHAGLRGVHIGVWAEGAFLGTIGIGPLQAGSDTVQASSCARLLAHTLAAVAHLREHEVLGHHPGLHTAVQAVLRHLAQQPRADLRIDDVAPHAGLSASRLVHLLREQTGLTFTELRLRAVMRRACALLRAGTPVAIVAASVGYRHPGWFATAFRKVHGVVPSRWSPPPDDQA
jgi:AraC-like DNA-binding protein